MLPKTWIRFALLSAAVVVCAHAADFEAWDRSRLEAFVDGLMEGQQKSANYAGAVVVIVRDNQIALAKGYGYADAAERKPVDPQRTLFRIASNSKMFVWTSVMQLVEQGKLDLDTDVNRYLRGVQVPATFPDPITLRHLMTHTSGFEEKALGLFQHTAERQRPLAELMQRDMPRRIYPAGRVPAYSNYGTTLAALIVEQVSGESYDKYLQAHILGPLGMNHTSIAQPLPAELAADMSKGYRRSGGRWKEEAFEFVPWAPCGGMSMSGEDMTRFMLAHLNGGEWNGARILKAETVRSMRHNPLPYAPQIGGLLHGFMEMNWNGEKVYGHGGDTMWFHSLTAMLPERRMGYFVAYNTDSGAGARSDFSTVFLDHFFPTALAKETRPAAEAKTALGRFTGSYAPARNSESDISTIGKLMMLTEASVDGEGYLVMRSPNGTTRWRQIAPLVFAQVDGKRQLVFREEGGQVVDACASPTCVVALRKQPWWNSALAQYCWLGISAAILIAGLIGIPIAAVLQRHESRPLWSKLTRALAWLIGAIFLAGGVSMMAGMQDMNEVVFGVPSSFKISLTLWAIGALLTAVLAAMVVKAWRENWWRLAGRVCLTLLGVASVGLVLWLNHWNLLGWRY